MTFRRTPQFLGMPAGMGIVDGGEIPYTPEAAAKKQQNFQNRATADPNNKCFLPGVPRANYMPFPFQIFQTAKDVAILYEYVHAYRLIPLDGSKHPDDVDFWMGDSRGHWEGDTLVVDVSNNNDQTWFDASGNFHSEALHVVERYTRTGPNTISLRGHHRRSQGIHQALEDQPALLPPRRRRICSSWNTIATHTRNPANENDSPRIDLVCSQRFAADARAAGDAQREAGRQSRSDAARRRREARFSGRLGGSQPGRKCRLRRGRSPASRCMEFRPAKA